MTYNTFTKEEMLNNHVFFNFILYHIKEFHVSLLRGYRELCYSQRKLLLEECTCFYYGNISWQMDCDTLISSVSCTFYLLYRKWSWKWQK